MRGGKLVGGEGAKRRGTTLILVKIGVNGK